MQRVPGEGRVTADGSAVVLSTRFAVGGFVTGFLIAAERGSPALAGTQ